jgi:class 3 adenylate cyclase/tetratricopeptide (TPR) repeat protein
MQCPRCQRDNRAERRFCSGCGAELRQVCSRCGFANDPADQFCGGCGTSLAGAESVVDLQRSAPPDLRASAPRAYTPPHLAEKILTSRSALEGERKLVTVLFVDVSGFTGLSERLDPEDVHGLMARAFEVMLEEVHRYEGTVNQFLGDGIMALFGAPVAHEDHARRAVHAALGIRKLLDALRQDLQRQRGLRFEVRQGLNTGLVVVGSIGGDLRMDYTAVGDTTNVAARLQQAADPGRIVISEGTHRLVSGYFHLRPLGHLALKGKTETIGAWEVVTARQSRSRLEVEAERGLTPFVGREPELRLLMERFEQAQAGEGQVVFIAGEAGIGKSRLLLEFRRRLGDAATWLEGRAMSFGRSIAFHPLIDLLKHTFRLEEADDETTIVAKIEASVVLLGEDLRPTLPWLRYLLAVDPGDTAVGALDPQLRRAEIFSAVRRLLLRAAEVRPQVVVFEDAHWMDQATEEYVGLMADSITTGRVLMVLTYRPGYVPPFGERTYHARIALRTLSGEDSGTMARAMLGAEALPDDLQTLIAQKAEGNPFFVEEVVKSLQEIGALRRLGDGYVLARRLDEILVPDTIQDVIMARIDRLEDAPKRTLQVAAVIGREFTQRLLERLADIQARTGDYVRTLKALELIYEKRLFPELAFMFKHALTHDVAYNSLLVQRRRELHHQIARAVEELYADRLAEQYEILAHHYSRAEDWPKALEYLLKAAEKAAQGFANREAIALYNQALEIADHLEAAVSPATRMAIHRARAALFVVVSDFALARAEWQHVAALAQRARDPATEAEALAFLSLAAVWAHDFGPALDASREAIEVAETCAAKAPAALARLTAGWTHTVNGRLDQGRAEMEQGLELSRTAGDRFTESCALSLSGQLETWAGKCDTALALQSEALRIARTHKLVFPLCYAFFANGITLATRGDYDTGRAMFEEGLTFTEKVGDQVWYQRLLNCLGWLHIELGNLDQAFDLNRRGSEGARKRGDPETAANSELNLGDILVARGDLALAGELLEGVHRLVADPAVSEWQKWRYSTHLFASLGELWLARGDLARAGEFVDRCLEVATRTTSRNYLAWGWRLAGEIARARRHWGDAERELGEAMAAARVVGNPTQLWKTHLALGRLRTATGRHEGARDAYRAAREIIERTTGGVRDQGLRAIAERSPMFREVYDLSGPA